MSIEVDLHTQGIQYIENQGSLILFDSATISSADNPVDTVTVSLANPSATESLVATTLPEGYSASFDIDTGVLTITGGSGDVSDATWESVLRSVQYINTSDDPATDQTVTVVASDTIGPDLADSLAISVAMTVAAVNDAPVIAGDLTATVDAGGIYLITQDDLAAVDPDDTVTGLTYTVQTQLNGLVRVDGLAASTFSLQDILDGKVTFAHDGSATTQAGFGFTLADGGEDGAVPATGNFNLTVIPENHTPQQIAPLVDQAVQIGRTDWSHDLGAAFGDPDVGDILHYSASLANGDPLPSWMHVDADTGVVSGTPGFEDRGTFSLLVTATDQQGLSASNLQSLTLAVTVFDAGQLLVGSAGNDGLVGTVSNDTVTYAYAGAAVTVSLALKTQQNTVGAGLDILSNINNLIGSNQADNLSGDVLGNVLDGGAGADTLKGAGGDDIYVVDNAGDVVTEVLNAGTDTVLSSVTFALKNNVENLILLGNQAINGTGNNLANMITGNAASNTLNGGAGADSLAGGFGDDIYTVDNTGDSITEDSNAGADRINSSVSFTLPNQVENLFLTGTLAINGVGNDLANLLQGNAAANILDGAAGADVLKGGGGDDVYWVENSADTVNEALNAGTDKIRSTVTYTLPNNVESLELLGTAVINGNGNTLGNVLIGNAASNVLNGAAGADTLAGGLGDDGYTVDNVGDVVTELPNEGLDRVNSSVSYVLPDNVENLTLTGNAAINATGNGLNNSITGNAAANVIDGGAGHDVLNGGNGDNTLTGGSGVDYFQFRVAGHIDTITDFNVVDDTIKLDKKVFSVFTNPLPSPIAPGQFVTGTQALDANDFIVYNKTTGAVFYDADGNGAGEAVQFAGVTPGLALTNGDFHVI